jgi:hypothetical protein
MCTKEGLEVKGFNQLQGVYSKETTFMISSFRNKVYYEGSDDDDPENLAPIQPDPPKALRRNSDPVGNKRVTNYNSRAPSRAQSDKGHIDNHHHHNHHQEQVKDHPKDQPGGTDPIKVTIKGKSDGG